MSNTLNSSEIPNENEIEFLLNRNSTILGENRSISPIKKEEQEEEEIQYTPLDILLALWNRAQSNGQNLKSIIATITNYIVAQKKIDDASARTNEASTIEEILTELYNTWEIENQLMYKMSAINMHNLALSCMQEYPTLSRLNKDLVKAESYRHWIRNHENCTEEHMHIVTSESAKSNILEATAATSSSVILADNKNKRKHRDIDNKTDTNKKKKQQQQQGLDSLIDNDFNDRESNLLLFAQHVSRLTNGRLYALKTPGEQGSQLIRLQWFDTQDLIGKDLKNWWKYAKVRAQFLIGSTGDCKESLIHTLLNEAINDLTSVSGATREVKNFSSDN